MLRGAANIWINRDIPRVKQPFWDVASVPVLQAPAAEFVRTDIILWRQSQLPDLQFKRGREGGTERNGLALAPIRIASAIHKMLLSPEVQILLRKAWRENRNFRVFSNRVYLLPISDN